MTRAEQSAAGVSVVRFLDKVMPEPNSGCWYWIAATDNHGYGIFFLNGKRRYAHRVSYQLFVGLVPEGMCVCHHCDVTECVNPDHLWIGNHKDNMADCAKKGRSAKRTVFGEKHGCSKLKEDDVRNIRILASKGYLRKDIAKIYCISPAQTSAIARRVAWKHI